ncbi:hypothetical protein [Methylobacterium terricola]|uniref:hypothetical protein n=1 Tax=Methylobacterium terricola TaxID=2583531 RepID=UPI001485E2D4|nr:hypothetical protein [Methylobacterium terricola]
MRNERINFDRKPIPQRLERVFVRVGQAIDLLTAGSLHNLILVIMRPTSKLM